MKEIRLLRADEIEVKVKQVTQKGAILLLYKNARTDMNILDEVYGAENWTNEYKEIGGVLFCGIGKTAATRKKAKRPMRLNAPDLWSAAASAENSIPRRSFL